MDAAAVVILEAIGEHLGFAEAPRMERNIGFDSSGLVFIWV
jgi:hypothetical protein